MGFMKVKAPNSHNRKRLAVESRRHASRDDSHMFIIKLPPNLHYYTSPNGVQQEQPHQMAINGVHDNAQKIASFLATEAAASVKATMKANTKAKATQQAVQQTEATAATEASALKTNGKKVNGIPLGYTKSSKQQQTAISLARPGLFLPGLAWLGLLMISIALRMCTEQIAKENKARQTEA